MKTYDVPFYMAFEVQFHTENTFEIKTNQHDDYEIQKGFNKVMSNDANIGQTGDIRMLQYKEIYKNFMELYDDEDTKKNYVDSIAGQFIDSEYAKEVLDVTKNYIDEKLLNKNFSNNDFQQYFIKDELKTTNSIFDKRNKKFTDILIDKDSMQITFSDQFNLMKELFILCRCIKNNDEIYNKKESFLSKTSDLDTELVKKCNCFNYSESKLQYLENKYKNPTFEVSQKRRKKYDDYFDNKKIKPLNDLMTGSYNREINKKFLVDLCKFLGIRHSQHDKQENVKKITDKFNEVMKKDIGVLPFC